MLSVIIATYKRAPILHTCLEHLAKQTCKQDLEVLVISDGPDAATKAVASEKWDIPMQYHAIPKAQQGVARNLGVKHAQGEWCMFINDDIFLQPNACKAHLNALSTTNIQEHSTAVLGFTTWDPALQINNVMRFLEQSGWQFGYPNLTKYSNAYIPQKIQSNYTYSSHISLPTTIARQLPFTTTVQYGWEDIEWGEQLQQAGVQLWYEPNAIGYHHHFMTLEDSLQRAFTIGNSLAELEHTHPTFRRSAQGIKLLKQKVEAMLPTLAGKHRKAFFQGIKQYKDSKKQS